MRRYNAELLKMIKSVGLTESYNELRTCTAEELLPILAEFDNQQELAIVLSSSGGQSYYLH